MKLSRRAAIRMTAASAMLAPHVVRAQTAELKVLFQSSMIPGADGFVRDLARAWGEERGIAMIVDFSGTHDVAARTSRVLRGGEQRDVVELQDFQPMHRPELLLDVTALAQENAATQGAYPDWVVDAARLSEVWYGVPTVWAPAALVYRPSMLAALGVQEAPTTWDSLFRLTGALVTAGLPAAAIPLAQSPIAPIAFANSYLWSHGGQEVVPGSGSVGFTAESMQEPMQAFADDWRSGFLPEARGWNDGDVVTAFLEQRSSIVISSPESFVMARLSGDEDVACAPMPSGDSGRFALVGSRSLAIPQRSPNKELAMEFVRWWTDPAQMTQWVVAYQGCVVPWQTALHSLPVFVELQPFLDRGATPRRQGYAARDARAQAEVATNYFLVNTYADVAKGVDPAAAIETARQLMVAFYG